MGWRWKQNCAETPDDIMQYVEQDYPVSVHVGDTYYSVSSPRLVSFNGANGRLIYSVSASGYGSSASSSLNVSSNLTACTVNADGVFNNFPVQDVMIWLTLGLLFLFGFHSGKH
jgi:hypothetical protein